VFKGVLPAGFVVPCLPTKAAEPPSGGLWLHEIKHDGFRVIARKDNKHVRLYSRPGNNLTWRFPLIVQALGSLRSRSCVIDADEPELQELRLKLGSDGKTYLGPDGPAPDPRDREVVGLEGRVLVMRWVNSEVASRYGTSVYVRCSGPSVSAGKRKAG
jgi:ATP dependent DNA ligase domain